MYLTAPLKHMTNRRRSYMSTLYQWAKFYPCRHTLWATQPWAHTRYPNTRPSSACHSFFYCYRSTFVPAHDVRSRPNAKFRHCLNIQLKTDGCSKSWFQFKHTDSQFVHIFGRALCITETSTERCRVKEMTCASTANFQYRWTSGGGCLTAHQATRLEHTAGNTSLSACSYCKCSRQWSTRIHTNTNTME